MAEDRLTSLYREYGQAIYWRCLKILRDEAAAEDATARDAGHLAFFIAPGAGSTARGLTLGVAF